VNRRWIFIGTGTFLLVVGLSGLALLQTSVFETIVGPRAERRLDFPQPGISNEVPGQPGQSRLEGKIPAPSQKQIPTAPQAGAPADNPASQPVPPLPGGGSAEVSPWPDENAQGQRTETPSQIPPVLKGERRHPGQTGISPPPPARSIPGTGSTASGVAENARRGYASRQNIPETQQPVTIKFVFDPEHGRDIKVARVHFGDRVVIKVRRFGPANRQIFLGFDLPERTSGRSYSYSGRVVRKSSSVITPVSDSDQLTISGKELFGPSLARRLDSKDGAILKVGAKHPGRQRFDHDLYRGDNGRCEVEIRIYSGNRWNLKPRSLL